MTETVMMIVGLGIVSIGFILLAMVWGIVAK